MQPARKQPGNATPEHAKAGGMRTEPERALAKERTAPEPAIALRSAYSLLKTLCPPLHYGLFTYAIAALRSA